MLSVPRLLSSRRQFGTFPFELHLMDRNHELDQEAGTQDAATCEDDDCKRFVNFREVPGGYIGQNRCIWQHDYRTFEPDVFHMCTTKNSACQEKNKCKPEQMYVRYPDESR